MAKRFTDSDKWTDPWFRRLPPKTKLLWLYLVDSCDNAGFWVVDFELASYLIGENVSHQDIIPYSEGRIVVGEDKWEITKFIDFQYGKLSTDCKPHQSILKTLEKQRVSKGYPKGIHTLEDKDKDKDKEGGVGETKPTFCFEQVWDKYPNKDGRKIAERCFKSTVKTNQDFIDINKALENYLSSPSVAKGFIKNGSTWFNNWRDWVCFQGVTSSDSLSPAVKELLAMTKG
jgi:hypothetical protein